MKRIYVFCHGFCFNSNYWSNLKQYFKNKTCIYLDLGYFNQQNITLNYNSNYSYVGIGHSLGLTKLLQFNFPFTHLIGLNSFINFLGNDNYLYKKRSLELKLLTKNFINNTTNAITNFYKTCGLPNYMITFNNLNKDQLLKDLSDLKLSYVIPKSTRTLIIGSKNDIIVPEALIHDNFNSLPNIELTFLQEGNHALGINNAKEVSLLIDDFLYE